MSIALIGPSGAGKGTQADKLMARFDYLHLSTGDLFRESLLKQSALGILARKYVTRGELVPDEVVDAMIEEWLLKIRPEKELLFDGFPRTMYQAKSLDTLLKKTNRSLDAAIYLRVSDEEIIRRLPGRVICRTCQVPYHLDFRPPAQHGICDRCRGQLYQRDDDTPEIIRTRLRASHRVTEPLAEYYQKTDRLLIVDGEGRIREVYRRLVNAIQALERDEAEPATKEETTEIRALKGRITAIAPEKTPHRSLDIVLLGGPGSGKGTQAERLRTEFNLPHIATGDLFRENINKKTDLGALAKSYIDRGELVPDDVTESMVRRRLDQNDTSRGFILDGFPRTRSQAEALTEMMTDLQRGIDAVLYINVSDQEIVNRLSGRLICRDCQTPYHVKFKPPVKEGICDLCDGELYQRDDDNPETIKARLNTYHGQTAPVIGYYRDYGLLVEIDGEGEVPEVTQRTLNAVQTLLEDREDERQYAL